MSVDVVLVVAAGAVLAIGLVSSSLKRLWLSAPLVALAAGVVLGPDVTGAVDPARLGPERRVSRSSRASRSACRSSRRGCR